MATNKDKEISEALKAILKKLGERIEELDCDMYDADSTAETEGEVGSLAASQQLAELLIDSRASTQDKIEGAQELIDIIIEPALRLLVANKEKLGLTDIILYVGGEIDGKPYCDTKMTGEEDTTVEDIIDVFATACARALAGYKKHK